ncbi:MAG: hypothetical protein H7145_23570 [Akkermansiaceae bacterium]|nr:hypothetical protein [Armatimonadota bacterium]
MAISREIGLKFTLCYAHLGLARLACLQGHYAQSHSILKEALLLSQDMGADWAFAFVLETNACAAAGQGSHETAAALWGAAARLREMVGAPLPQAYADIYQPFEAAARNGMGEAAFTTAWQRARQFPSPGVLELAQGLT